MTIAVHLGTDHRASEDRRDCCWLYVVTNCDKEAQLQEPVEALDAQFMKRIGRWKVEHSLGLADAFAAATAEENGCPLVTTDRNDFGAIEAAGALQIVWLR